jgi:PhnB protein
MSSQLNPYLNFRDTARPAMEFYKTVFGGKVTFNTFGEFHMAHDNNPTEANKIMHSTLEADNGISFFAADTPVDMEYTPGGNISMSLSGDNEKELRGYYDKLAASGKVTVPMEQAPWGDIFGMCVDKFGINWLVNCVTKK